MYKEIYLFTDGSVNPQSKIGYGAFVLVQDIAMPLAEVKKCVQVEQFENTSSTKLELQILLFALAKIEESNKRVIVCTDSQNIVGLPGRRSRFENNNYISKKGRRIANHELYKEFYRLTDSRNCQIVKVKGHKVSGKKDDIDSLFTLVDRASRAALREKS